MSLTMGLGHDKVGLRFLGSLISSYEMFRVLWNDGETFVLFVERIKDIKKTSLFSFFRDLT